MIIKKVWIMQVVIKKEHTFIEKIIFISQVLEHTYYLYKIKIVHIHILNVTVVGYI